MCDPVTLTIAATAVTSLASAAGGVMALQQGNYQARVARENAKLADQSAVDAIEQGKRDVQLSYRKQAQLRGTQRAAQAANGIDLSFGSALDIEGDTRMIGREDANTLSENAMRASKGYSIEAMNYRTQATSAKMKGAAGLVSGMTDALSTGLSGASKSMQLKAAGY